MRDDLQVAHLSARRSQTNKWNQDDEINYSHALARRLPAEVLYDAIHRATGSQAAAAGLAGRRPGRPAARFQRADLPGGFLDLFGKPARESACECERSSGMMLGPVLNLVNGPVLADAIKDPNNRLAKLAATEKDDKKLIQEHFPGHPVPAADRGGIAEGRFRR